MPEALMKFILPTLLVLIFTGLPLAAQEPAADAPKAPKGRLAWLVATAIPDDLENPVTVLTGKDLTAVTLSKRMPSEPVKIPADGLISIIRKPAQPVDPAKPAYEILGRATIPEGMSQALIILLPVVRKEGSSTVFQAKVQDLATFNGGDTLYLNLTTLNIAVQLGDQKLALKPGMVTIHRVGSLDKATNTPVSYHFFHPTQEQWRLLSASTVVLQPTRREICIFSWDPRFNRVDYHGITFPVTQ
jgi:hypothetical protein